MHRGPSLPPPHPSVCSKKIHMRSAKMMKGRRNGASSVYLSCLRYQQAASGSACSAPVIGCKLITSKKVVLSDLHTALLDQIHAGVACSAASNSCAQVTG